MYYVHTNNMHTRVTDERCLNLCAAAAWLRDWCCCAAFGQNNARTMILGCWSVRLVAVCILFMCLFICCVLACATCRPIITLPYMRECAYYTALSAVDACGPQPRSSDHKGFNVVCSYVWLCVYFSSFFSQDLCRRGFVM